MTLYIVDASVGIKWFVQEVHTDAANRLQNPDYELHVPGLFDVEMGNILWKKVQRSELTSTEATQMIADLTQLKLTRHADRGLVVPAFAIASTTGRTLYDSVYIALAAQLGGQAVTADEKLYNALQSTPWRQFVCWVADVA